MLRNATRICLDRKKCATRHAHGNAYLAIPKGAKILSNPSHLRTPGLAANGVKRRRPRIDAIEYELKEDVQLLLPDVGESSDMKQLLIKLSQLPRLTPTQQQAARKVCTDLKADGWYVQASSSKGLREALVVLDPRRVLQ